MPTLSAHALCSVADAQAWLRRSHAAGQQLTDDTALLILAINGASSAIIGEYEREFSPSSAGVARTFEYDGSGFLDLRPYEAQTITSVTLGGQTLTLTTGQGDGDYVPMPRNQTREGTFLYLTLRSYFRLGPSHFLSSPVLKTRDVVVTGTWGMAAIPDDVYTAALIATADYYRNPEQGAQRGSGEFQIVEEPRNPGDASGLPRAAVDMLERYRRTAF